MKRVALLCLVLLLIPLPASATPPAIRAKAAILMDVNSGEVLYAQNIAQMLPVASLTKIMTGLLVAEYGWIEDMVVVPWEATQVVPSAIWIREGEVISLKDLLYGLMLRSGNDAAVAIAHHLAGSVESFSEHMNRRAEELGAYKTNFVNPNGLPADNHYSTAYDMALICRAALLEPLFKQVVATERYVCDSPPEAGARVWFNSNKMLKLMPTADGVKTGWTTAAGHCLAVSATVDGWPLVAIVLSSPDHYRETRELLEWGFRDFLPLPLLTKGQGQGVIGVKKGDQAELSLIVSEDLHWVIPQGHEPNISYHYDIPSSITAPVKAGDEIGKILVQIDDSLLSAPVVAAYDITRIYWWQKPLRTLRGWFGANPDSRESNTTLHFYAECGNINLENIGEVVQ